jgi:RNA polymerase sigma factor (sigma-70 family)
MHDAGDMELLREYDRQGSEAAFATLVQRHVSLVYSAALRHVGIAAHAEEITQAVFVILARKAARLRPDTILESWLYETTRLTALSFRRGERRRQFREQEAYMQSTLQESADASTWNQLAPLLDEAMARLGNKDRAAVLLRFFKNKNLREVAAALKVNETAAQRRVHRAVGKLRAFFTKRGIILPAVVLTAAISANSVQAAPVALAKAVTAVAIAKGAAASISTLTLIEGALKIMAWTKAKTAIIVSTIIFLAAGTTFVAVRGSHGYRSRPIEISQNLEFFSDASTITFESFLTNPPVIEDAEYEVIDPPPPPEILAQMKQRNPDTPVGLITTNFCSLRLDGANYILKESPMDAYHGRFADAKWRFTQNNILLLADTKINSSQGIESFVGFPPYVIKRFLNFGIDQMIPGTIEWPKGADHFTAKIENPFLGKNIPEIGTVDVQLHYENGVPLTAVVENSFGAKYEIRYKYALTFFNGKLPIEIDDVGMDRNGNSIKVGTVLIDKLQLANSPIATTEFDPTIVFKGKHRGYIYLSNDVSYGVTEGGRTYRVRSLDQAP